MEREPLRVTLRLPGWLRPGLRVLTRLREAAAHSERCLACGRIVAGCSSSAVPGCCPECAAQLVPRRGGYCPGCGELTPDPDADPHVCGTCLREGREWSGFCVYGEYGSRAEGELLKRLIWAYKFHGRLGKGRLVQELTAKAFRMHHSGPLPDLLAPVPLHASRLRWRGYNQSLEMGRLLARELNRPLDSGALVRVRKTAPQSSLPGKVRLTNLRGAFQADENIVGGRRVLLLDDVMTTGATLRECTHALKEAGALEVCVLVLARGV